jgi:dUTP pyrophosphatase
MEKIEVAWKDAAWTIGECAKIPEKGTPGSNGYDLFAAEGGEIGPVNGMWQKRVRLGFHVELPPGVAMLILPRSGLATNEWLSIPNSPALIDFDYRGEVMVTLRAHERGKVFRWDRGDRLAQAIFIRTLDVSFRPVSELSATERGAGGFGSTGVKG